MTWYERIKPKVTIKKQKSMEALDKLRTYATDSRRWPDFQTHFGDMIGKSFFFTGLVLWAPPAVLVLGYPEKTTDQRHAGFLFEQNNLFDFSNCFLNIQGVAMPFLTAALQRPQTHSWWDPKRWMLTLWNFWRI